MGAERARIQVVIPFHQPLNASDDTIKKACEACYAPLIEAIGAHKARLTLHFSGHLLDYLAREREDLLMRLREHAKAGQIEVLSGLFYGGIPELIPEMDVAGQLQMSAEFWESYLGQIPNGFWVPELAWCAELPRLFTDSGLHYGFISDTQFKARSLHRGFGAIERGGQRLAAFVLDEVLSGTLPSRPVDEWIDAMLDRSGDTNVPVEDRITSVWVRAESLGLEPGTAAWCVEAGWLDDWLDALGGGRVEVATVLPAETAETLRPAVPFELRPGCASDLGAYGRGLTAETWGEFQRDFVEVDTLYRRMLRVSDKLRDAIATMEDDGVEDDWSDSLATAQRLVFSAQAPDAYWRGPVPGFSDPTIRDAVVERLDEAESYIDVLIQGEEDWISIEEQDHDGDLSEEVFVTSAHTNVWIVPAEGGAVRVFDTRILGRNLIDVGTRRKEPFFASMSAASWGDEPSRGYLPRRGDELRRMHAEMPTEVDAQPWRGLRSSIVDHRTSAEEFFGGSAVDLTSSRAQWEVVESGIDEDGDYSFRMVLKTQMELEGLEERRLTLIKRITVPIDSAEVRIEYEADLIGSPEVLLITEVPMRFGEGEATLFADGSPANEDARELEQAKSIRLETLDGMAVELASEKPFDLWWMPIRSSIKTLAGYDIAVEGDVVVPILRVDGRLNQELVLRLDVELEEVDEEEETAYDDDAPAEDPSDEELEPADEDDDATAVALAAEPEAMSAPSPEPAAEPTADAADPATAPDSEPAVESAAATAPAPELELELETADHPEPTPMSEPPAPSEPPPDATIDVKTGEFVLDPAVAMESATVAEIDAAIESEVGLPDGSDGEGESES